MVLDDEDDGMKPNYLAFKHEMLKCNPLTDVVLIDLPVQRPESYAFSVPLTSIYSLIAYPPSFSSWCKLGVFLLMPTCN